MPDEAAITAHLNSLCKPPGSLGTLERIAYRLCTIQQSLTPTTVPRHVTVFAADHGVTRESISAWPSEVTEAVVRLMQTGRTASGVFARLLGCRYEVVDVGLLSPVDTTSDSADAGCLINASRKRGTGNLRCEPAMTSVDFGHAWTVGAERANQACDAGSRVLIGGEMGIGNTTSASCLIALLCDVDPLAVTGRGAGIDETQLSHKAEVIADAVRRVQKLAISDPREIACQVGGLEIVALAGFFARTTRRGQTILLDGLIATAAAVLAERLCEGTRHHMIAAHRSTEPGHMTALRFLDLEPVLDLSMRLGEGSGALACLPLLDLAAAMAREMASLCELELGDG